MKIRSRIILIVVFTMAACSMSCHYKYCPTYAKAGVHGEALKMKSKSLERFSARMYKNQLGLKRTIVSIK